MTYSLKSKFSLLISGAAVGLLSLLAGCGGGGGGSSSTPSTPSPFDAAYNATYTPATAVPTGGQAPSGNLTVSNGKAALQTTFYLQQSVVTAVQNAINSGLTSAGYAGAIPDNQVPTTIAFTGSGQLDGNGKLVLTARKSVDICGTAILTVDPTFTTDGTTFSGTGTYNVTFSDDLTVKVRGREVSVSGTCNNLPLRSGTVAFTK